MTDKGATKNDLPVWLPDDETFRFGWKAWDVKKAKTLLLRKRSVKLHSIEVKALKPLANLMCVDWDRIKRDIALPTQDQTIDLRVPLILVLTPDGALPIDGWHRIGKAILLKVPVLPAVILSKVDERKVRH